MSLKLTAPPQEPPEGRGNLRTPHALGELRGEGRGESTFEIEKIAFFLGILGLQNRNRMAPGGMGQPSNLTRAAAFERSGKPSAAD